MKSWFYAGLILVLSSTGWGLQLSEIRSSVRLRIRDATTDTNNQRFSNSQLNDIINEGQRDVINKTWLLTATTFFGLTLGITEYNMPDDFLAPIRVTVSSRTIAETSYNGLDQDSTDWTVRTATPTSYYLNHNRTQDQVYMGFVPKPSTTSVNSVFIFYAREAPTMTSDTNEPFDGKEVYNQHHETLVDYTTGICWLIQGRHDLAKLYMELYTNRTEFLRRNAALMPNFNPALRGDRGPRQ